MNKSQIAQAARDAVANPTLNDEYYQLWDSAAENEIGLFVQFEPDTVEIAVRGLLEVQRQVEWIQSMILVQPPGLPGVVYLMHRPLETVDGE
jgi:hypothetical protein